MAHYAYTLSSFNGTALPTANMRRCQFVNENGPGQTRRFEPVEAEVIGLGDRDVRAQPKGAFWEVHVELIAVDQTDLDALYDIFDEEAGLVYLKALDGAASPKTWRVQCRVVQIQRQDERYFMVVLRVPDPTWEEDTAVTDSQLNKAGDSFAFTLTNAGKRQTRPSFIIRPDSVKTDILDDYKFSYRGFIVNRSPAAWSNLPVLLTDVSGADSALDHKALVTGTKRADVVGALAAGAVSIPYDGGVGGNPPTLGIAILKQQRAQINNVSGITATATTIAFDTGTNGNPPASGLILIDDELIYYTSGGAAASGTLSGCIRGYANTKAVTHLDNAPMRVFEQVTYTGGGGGATGTLTGVTRAVGGTLDQAHSDNTEIYFSEALVNGDDLRVWLNNIEVERWLSETNTTALRIWANVSMPPASILTLREAIPSASTPADGGSVSFNEDVSLLPESGLIVIDSELISYSGKNVAERAVTGIERGAWGTAAAAHPIDAERANIDDAGGISATVLSVGFADGRNGNPPTRGRMFIDDEEILYTDGGGGASGTLTGLIRGVNGTLAAAHDDDVPIRIPQVAYLCSTLFVVGLGKGTATPGPGPLSHRPALDLRASTNASWRWGDTASDPLTVFYDPRYPERSASWLPSNDVPVEDRNAARPLRLESSLGDLTWAQRTPTAGKPLTPRLVRELPQHGLGGTITRQARNDILLRLLGRDWTGNEKLLASIRDINEAASTTTPVNTDEFHSLILNGARAMTTGHHVASSGFKVLDGVLEYVLQKVVIKEDCEIFGAQVRLKKAAADDSYTFAITLRDDSGGATPEAGLVVATFNVGGNGELVVEGDFTASAIDTTFDTFSYMFYSDEQRFPRLHPGTYWLGIGITIHTAGDALHILDAFTAINENDRVRLNGVWSALPIWFRLLYRDDGNAGPIQQECEDITDEASGGFASAPASVTAIIADVGTPTLQPFVHRNAGFTNGLYHCVGRLANTMTGDTMDIDVWMAAVSELHIDTEARSVTYVEDGLELPIPGVVTPSNRADWLPLIPGTNDLTYDEDNMTSTDITTTFRSKKV